MCYDVHADGTRSCRMLQFATVPIQSLSSCKDNWYLILFTHYVNIFFLSLTKWGVYIDSILNIGYIFVNSIRPHSGSSFAWCFILISISSAYCGRSFNVSWVSFFGPVFRLFVLVNTIFIRHSFSYFSFTSQIYN